MPIDLAFDTIDLDCEKTWSLISDGNTKGVFQLESRLGQSMAKKLKPQNIEQLAALISILRPGCISGDTKIFVKKYIHTDGRTRFKKVKIRDITENLSKYKTLLSYNEKTGKFIDNKIIDAFYTGNKECFKVIIRTNERKNSIFGSKEFKLECTLDHKLLTPDGWKALKDIQIGDRILVNQRKGTKKAGLGTKSFKQRCYNTYKQKCIFCDWSKGSLDVNHIKGNRFTNNDPNNLCYLCPNHHREFSEGTISIETLNETKESYRLPKTIDGKWCTLVDKISVGIKDVYDISMEAPHHNFIAGGIIVHNCLEAVRDGKNVSNHYIDKKNGEESIDYFHTSLESILHSTYGEMVYQEQAMQICQKIANFSLSEADMLRKAIGKKNPKEMAKIKQLFIDRTKELKIVTEEESEQIFSWIEKSQRYSFNKSHAISYAMNAYVSAYAKAHYPKEFFVSYLKFAKDKIDPMKEINELINNANEFDIKIYRPDIRKLNKDFILDNDIIYFGLTNIKSVGDSVYAKLIKIIESNNLDINNMLLNEYILLILDKINSNAAKALVSVGALDHLKVSRKKILFYLDNIRNLSQREKDILLKMDNIKSLPLDQALEKLLPEVNKNRKQNIQSMISSIKSPPYSLDDSYDWIANIEKNHLGISITCSIVDSRDLDAANTDCQSINRNRIFNKSIIVGAEIEEISVVKTKTGANPGKEMAFVKISDGTGLCDIIVFPKEFDSYRELLYQNNTVMFSIEKAKNKDSLIVKKCWQI
jgi:DNA polymerase III alpha subunit